VKKKKENEEEEDEEEEDDDDEEEEEEGRKEGARVHTHHMLVQKNVRICSICGTR
jgi:hypothetical protein